MLAWAGVDEGTLLGKPFEQRLADARGAVSALTSRFLPGARHVPSTDVQAYPKTLVGNAMVAAYMADMGYRSPAEMTEADWAVLAEQFNREEGAYWDAALAAYVRTNGVNALTSAVIPGPKSTRQQAMLDNPRPFTQRGAGPDAIAPRRDDPYADNTLDAEDRAFLVAWNDQFGRPYAPGDLERYRAAVSQEQAVLRATPEAQPYLRADAAWRVLGTTEARRLLDGWAGIAYAEPEGEVRVAGRTYRADELRAMTQEARYALADAWLLQHDPSGEVAALRDEREVFLATHPEYALYRDWQTEVRESWGSLGPQGLRAYRIEVSRGNPNARRYFEEEQRDIIGRNPNISNAELQAELDRVTTTASAYLAIHGIREGREDPRPLATDRPGRQVSDPRPPGWTGDGGSGGGRGGQDRATWILGTIAQAELAAQVLMANGMNLRHAPPPVQQHIIATAPPGLLPDDLWIWYDYLEWKQTQELAGVTNTSPEAYVVATSGGDWRRTSWVSVAPPTGEPFAGWAPSFYAPSAGSTNGAAPGLTPGATFTDWAPSFSGG
jgi:hypothetical protein